MDPKPIQDLSFAGRHQECLQACQELLKSEPDNPVIWKYRGKSLLALGQPENAQQCLAKAHQLDMVDPEITKDIGNTYLNLGDTNEAKKWYEKSLLINQNYAPAICNLANIKRWNGYNQEAADLYKRAINEDPQLVLAYTGAASSYLALGDIDQAESLATRAIQINPTISGVNEVLANVCQTRKDYKQAIKFYQKELKFNPRSRNSLLNLGLLFLQQGNAEASIGPLTIASKICETQQCSLLLAQAHQKVGNLKEAIAEYTKIDISKSQNKLIPFSFGLCLLNEGSNVDAIEAFNIAIKIDSSFLPAWINIATAFQKEGNYKEAQQATEKVLRLDPDNSDAHLSLGVIHTHLGNLDQALACTLRSRELRPDNPITHRRLAGIYKNLGHLDQALASILASLELQPTNAAAHMNLGEIYKALGKLDEALESTLQSINLKPSYSPALTNLAAIYLRLGLYKNALTASLQSIQIDPKNPSNYLNLSQAYKQLDDMPNAVKSINHAIRLDNQNALAYLLRGMISLVFGSL